MKTLAQAREALLMLDYDGTLAPFRKERNQAFPYPAVKALLQTILRESNTRVVIVSGRDSAEVIPLLGIDPPPEMWGLHGLQRRRADGTLETARLQAWVLDALADADRWLGYQQLQHLAEFKTGSIAIHWRGVPEPSAKEVRGRILLGWNPIAERTGLKLLDFECGIEIRAPKATKGNAVGTLLAEMGRDTAAAYLGDDATDEDAFREIQGRGLSVLVRPRYRKTTAQAWLKPPEELLTFLKRWLGACANLKYEGGNSVAAGSRSP